MVLDLLSLQITILAYILSTAKLDATGQRWVAELANYNFIIKYRAGRHNIDGDALSRITRLQQDSHQGVSDIISVDVVQAICQAVVVSPAYVNCLSMNHQPVNCMNISNTPLFQSNRNILAEQLKDKTIKPFLLHLKDGTPLMKEQLTNPDQFIHFRHLDSLHLRDRVLYRQRTVD